MIYYLHDKDIIFDYNRDNGDPNNFMFYGKDYRQSRAKYNKEEISAYAIGQEDIHIGFRSGKLVTVSRNGDIKRTWSPVPSKDSDNRFLDLYRNENMTVSADEVAKLCVEFCKISPEFLERQRRFEEQRLLSQDSFYRWEHAIKDVFEDGQSLYAASPYGLFVLESNSKDIKQIVEGNFPINVEFNYARGNNKVILSGPHSGGKTELLKNIGVYHALALSGFFVPAEYANVPMTRRIITSFKKSTEKNKGSLESEINETSEVIRGLQQGDLVLWDEFLDTTKPELAAYLEEPLLEGFASTPATIVLLSHRATSLRQEFGFRFMYPELEEIEVPEEEAAYYIRSENTKVDKSGFKEGEKKIKLLIPTRKFIEGKPTPELTRDHAF